MSATPPKYLIVGQGLAGTVMAFTLIPKGVEVAVVTDPDIPSASQVAAGLFNPVTGRKFVKTWLADALFASFPSFYRQLQETLQARFFYPKPMYRPFVTIEAQNAISGRLSGEEYQGYVASVEFAPRQEMSFCAPHGGVMLHQTGNVDLPVMLAAAQSWLLAQGRLTFARFDEADLTLHDDRVSWQGNDYDRVIFCRGQADMDSQFWSALQFRPSKGEVLTVQSAQYQTPYIVNKKSWLLPMPNGTYRLGATYDNHQVDLNATDEAKTLLLENLSELTEAKFEVLAHQVGIRPATHDRRPYLGVSPAHSRIALFNGLGAKGVSLAPYFADHLADHLLEGKPLMKEVDLRRVLDAAN